MIFVGIFLKNMPSPQKLTRERNPRICFTLENVWLTTQMLHPGSKHGSI